MSFIRLKVLVNGELTDATSVALEDEGATFGIRETNDLIEIIDAGEAFTRASKGFYTYEYDNNNQVLVDYVIKIVYSGETYHINSSTLQEITEVLISLPAVASYYSSQAEVLRIIGNYAGELLLEDRGTSTGQVWIDLLQDADDTIKMYILQHYDPENLYTNRWIRRRATMLVANLLSARRGNAPLYTTRVERIYDELNTIRDGRFRIPGATVRSFQGPVVRNYIMQNRFWNQPLRVEKLKSTGDSYDGESISIEPYIYYYG